MISQTEDSDIVDWKNFNAVQQFNGEALFMQRILQGVSSMRRLVFTLTCLNLILATSLASAGELLDRIFDKDHCVDECCDISQDCVVGDLCSDADSCGLNDGCSLVSEGRLLGLFAPTDHCFGDFISPMTNPVYFEDPRTLTEARFIYIHHNVPDGAGGGEINAVAGQVRLALTDRLSIVAPKDGYLTSSNAVIDDGFIDVSAGLKYNIIRDPEAGRLLSAGFLYELPIGSTRAAQGNGDGEFALYTSGGTRIGDRAHYLFGTGLRLPANTAAESKSFFLSQHLDYMLTDKLYGLVELNWFNWFDGGEAGVPGLPFLEGGDLFNLGAPDVEGNNILTMGWGMKFKPAANQELGVVYEIPISSRNDVLDNRLTVDYIIRY